jgi:hypothetical protein
MCQLGLLEQSQTSFGTAHRHMGTRFRATSDNHVQGEPLHNTLLCQSTLLLKSQASTAAGMRTTNVNRSQALVTNWSAAEPPSIFIHASIYNTSRGTEMIHTSAGMQSGISVRM